MSVREIRSETQQVYATAVAMYADEPCRICGAKLVLGDVYEAVWAGYSGDNQARSAHRECWLRNVPQSEWKYQ